MTTITPTQIIQYAAYLVLLIIAGGLEYFNLLPANSTAGVFLLIVGHFFGNIPTSNALARNTQVQAAATTAANSLQAPTGPIHLVHHYETPPTPSPVVVRTSAHPNPIDEPTATPAPPEQKPIILPTPVTSSVPQVPFPEMPLHFGDSQMMPAVQP